MAQAVTTVGALRPFGLRWARSASSSLLWAAPLLAASALLPVGARTMVALVAIIILGVPHGALDGEIGRDLFRPRFGRLWFPVFSLPYLALSAGVLVLWRIAPMSTLAGFLAASVWHFGDEEAGDAPWVERLLRGGLPIALPTLVHPAATAAIFSTVTGQSFALPPAWLQSGSVVWLGFAVTGVVLSLARARAASLVMPALLAACFIALPPLTAFAIYFVGIHAPAHTRALVADRTRASRVRDPRSALWRALPLTAMTLVLGALLWPLYAGDDASARLLALTLQGLAALTLPHMLLEMSLPRLGRWLAAPPARD